ncbi:uncharacterized protein LOC121341328 [Onychostruthus taczanowskii]|uniref:uncharacterized protein LOC121341328 n=1 Tax=Onychostruthus taczanowskii TaxID=356909 RepID=UPI001B80CA24|nr:uncharacterized protein LOC121341328 [Onychostruthus taczanowskii]
MGVLGALLGGVLVAAAVAEPGVPVVSVFPARPPSPGEATTLVCLLENIFHPIFWSIFPIFWSIIPIFWSFFPIFPISLAGIPVVSVFPARPPSPGEATTLVCLLENIFHPIFWSIFPIFWSIIPIFWSFFPIFPISLAGIPVVSVFPARPPSPGEATTLVCLLENVFPPALTVGWTLAGAAVTRGVTSGPFVPDADLTFVRFSRISVTPRPGDVVACVVTADGDNATVVAYWVAPDAALDEQLDTALAGAALALGLILALLGAGLALLARRNPHG